MTNFSICTAIANLPVSLLTSEIIKAGVEEGNIRLLDCLPVEFMTMENIQRILQKSGGGWSSFSLSRLPVDKRSQEVCNVAVEKDIDNLPEVPYTLRNQNMLKVLMGSLKNHMHYLVLIPSCCWNVEAVYKGIRNLFSGNSSYDYRRGRYNHYGSSEYEKRSALEKTQVLLSFVPRTIKNRAFYRGLLSLSGLSVEAAIELIPKCHKQGEYHKLLAMQRPELVSVDKYTLDMFMAVLGPKSKINVYHFPAKSDILAKMKTVMNDALADLIIAETPLYFNDLSKDYQTVPRLLQVLDNCKDKPNFYHFVQGVDKSLLTRTVCQKFVKQTTTYPEFPQEIWNEAFVKHCFEHDKTYSWFEQIPRKLQTPEIVSAALEHSLRNIEYAEPKFVTYEVACKLNLEVNKDSYMKGLKKYIPAVYYENFQEMTGLPVEFMGGECSFSQLRENRPNFSYCQLGYMCIGFYEKESYPSKYGLLILTRRTPMSIRPQVIFNRAIGTYHKTWLEKMLADYDSSFVKPTVGKELKEYQTNSYYNVKYLETIAGQKVYANLLMGEPVCYVARTSDGLIYRSTHEKMVNALQ